MNLDGLRRVGHEVSEAWEKHDHEPEALPAIAESALRNLDSQAPLDLLQVIDLLLPDADGAFNPNAAFSDLPLAVFQNERLVVQLLIWCRGTADIHQHCFSGAFRVMQGSSIESRFDVQVEEQVGSALRLVSSRAQGVNLLRAGDVHPIRSGRRLTHAVFHLESPTLTAVVRSRSDPGVEEEYVLVSPRLAFVPGLLGSPEVDGLLRLMRVAAETAGVPKAFEIFEQVLPRLSFPQAVYMTLDAWAILRHDRDRAQRCAEEAYPKFAHLVPELLRELELRRALHRSRHLVKQPDERLVTAAMLVCRRPEDLQSLLSQAFDGAPGEEMLAATIARLPSSIVELWRSRADALTDTP